MFLLFLLACATSNECDLLEVYAGSAVGEDCALASEGSGVCEPCDVLGLEFYARASADTVYCW